jgi:GWxTD domain-containing protein
MKNLLLFLFIFTASLNSYSQNLSAFFSYCTFDIPGRSPYIETYLDVVGSSVKFVTGENSRLKGRLEVAWTYRQDDKVVHFDKYILNSPDITSADLTPDFIDQQRIELPAGDYAIELSIRDKNSDDHAYSIKQNVHLGNPIDTVSISSIELISSFTKTDKENKFTKNGYDVIPFVNSFYPKEINQLKFYAEVYRTDNSPAEDFLLRYYLSGKESSQVLENYIVSQKHSPKTITPVMGSFDISDLGSGNYFLNLEIRNKQNKIIAFRQAFFQRSNERNKPVVGVDIAAIDVTNTFISPEKNTDTLIDNISCLYPLSSAVELQIEEDQIQNHDPEAMKQFIYYFWSRRNPEDPEKAWRNYRNEVTKANDLFTSLNHKGYDTDRGRVFLKYGAPNAVSEVKDDPNSYPYEIWQYYKLQNQSNRKFVFYSTDLSTNDYKLIHSDATGELQEPKWELMMHGRTQQFGNDVDIDKSIDTYGSHTKDDFSNPH